MQLLWPAILFATPLLLAALGELVVERAGIVNIGIEGMMLAGALGAWAGNLAFGPVGGLICAIASAAACAVVFAGVVLVFSADQIVAGAAVNLLALGATGVIYRWLTPRFDGRAIRLLPEYSLAIVAVALAAGISAFFRFTRPGLELGAIGEAPHAADTAGVPVQRRQLHALLFGAACRWMAGAYLSTLRTSTFQENMTEGQGFLALALVIFGRWSSIGVVAAGLFFGLLRAYAERLIVRGSFPAQYGELLKALPYVLTLAALAGVTARSAAPAALGKPFTR